MKDKTFEQAIKELESSIQELESGEIDLDKSIKKYTESMELIKFCEKKLKEASKTINKLVESPSKEKDFKIEE